MINRLSSMVKGGSFMQFIKDRFNSIKGLILVAGFKHE